LEPCYLTVPLPIDAVGQLTASARDVIAAHPSDCCACGPGLGQQPAAVDLALWLYGARTGPLVVDADGLNALAKRRETWPTTAGPRILTPHPGEFRRLLGVDLANAALRQHADEWAASRGVVLVLKGHRTLVTDGQQRFENTTGNPGMATAGSGDVLTGIITALLGQGLRPFAAAQLGVYLHGLAGDLAAATLGQVALVARDIIDYLPAAFCRHADHGAQTA
jgi:NAD(P)H-hydrate epimerase